MICLLPVAWNVNTNILPGLHIYRNASVVCPVPNLSSVVAPSECLQYLYFESVRLFNYAFLTFLIRLSSHAVDCNYVRLDDYGSGGLRH